MTTTSLQERPIQPSSSEIRVLPDKLGIDIELVVVFLSLLSLTGQSIKYLTVYDEAFGLIPLVNMGKTLSIPTIFTVLLYFMAFLLLGMISAVKLADKDQFRWQWCGLTGLFLYLAFDRGTALHTYVFKLVRGWVSGLLPFFPYHRWVFSLGLVLIILVCFYLKFFKALPKETLKRALVSLGIYYLGFLLIERFGDDFAAIYSTNSFVFSILLTLGKTLEMSGLAAATYTLLKYLELTIPEISLEL